MTQADQAIQETIEPNGNSSPRTESAQAILVLGMHRSGTSALARVLNLLGVELGDDLLPPAADNEMGFWEHREVQFIHDRVYEMLKVDWTNVSPLPSAWWDLPEIEPYRQKLREILQRDFGNHLLWGIKDPRLCAMLPLWRPLLAELNVHPKCLLICRNPTEVANSLGKRDGLSSSRVYLLWLRSIIDSERGSRGLPRTITTYERVLADWPREVARIGQALEVSWPRQTSEVAAEVSDFIRPSVRHHQVDDERFLVDEQVPTLVRTLYAAVLKAAASGDTSELSASVDTVAEELDDSHPLLSQFVQNLEQEHRNKVIEKNLEEMRLNGEVGVAKQATATAVAASVDLNQKIALVQQQATDQHQAATQEQGKLQLQLLETQAQLASTQSQLQATQADLASTQSQLAATQAKVMAKTEEQSLAAKKIEHLREKARVLESHVCDQAGQIDELRTDKARVQVELGQYQIQRMVLLQVMQRMQTSRSWRWSATVRDRRRPPLTQRQLLPVTEMRSIGPNQWICEGPAQFVVPCLPIQGLIRIELKLAVNVAGHARLYFDTGHLFNAEEQVDLGPVEGDVSIEREVVLKKSVHCFRLDPLDRSGEFTIQLFRISRI